jgi:hypothetical protein
VSDGTTTASLAAFSITVTAAGSGPGNGTATISWSPPSANTNGTSPVTPIIGYTIFYGTDPSILTTHINIIGAGTTTYTVTGLASGTWYFAVAANAADATQSAMSALGSKTF